MRRPPNLAAAAVMLGSVALAACGEQPSTATAPVAFEHRAAPAGFLTTQPAQAYPLVSQATVKPILTVGDPLPGQEQNPNPELRVWAPIPDGLGATELGNDLTVFANHELGKGGVNGLFKYSRVSRLTLDRRTLAVKAALYPLTGNYLLERLCSATFVHDEVGFPTGYFLSGEEQGGTAKGSINVAVGLDGSVTELPWLGKFQHENETAVPGFPGKVVILGTDDTRGASELYMYLANSEADVLTGKGALHVFSSTAVTHAGNLTVGQTITGDFYPIADPTVSASALQSEVDGVGAAGALPFVRLEDSDYDRSGDDQRDRHGARPAIYFVDTGSETVIGRPQRKVPGVCTGACDPYGSIYRMDFDPRDPTHGARLTLVARSRGVAAGDWASPDNVAASENSLMVQEDPAYSGFNRAPRIYQFRVTGSTLGAPRPVVELTNSDCNEPLGTCWESSGIISTEQWLGAGTWLFDVQAHTLPVPSQNLPNEGGQLLYLRLPGS